MFETFSKLMYNQSNRKTFLLIYSQLKTGGVETLIVRMSDWLVKNDYKVKLLLIKPSELDHLLDHKIEVKYFKELYFMLFEPLVNKIVVNSSFFKDIDVIYSFESSTCLLASLIHKNLSYKPAFLTGVYQPNEYYSSEKKTVKYLPGIMQKMMLKMIPRNSVLFMNENNKKSVERNLKVNYNEDQFFPLPVNIKPVIAPEFRQPNRHKLVSIGRLTYFKTYHFHLVNLIAQFRSEGIELKYEVYGYGPQEIELKEHINKLNLQSNVVFKGRLDYDKMADVLSDTFLFVGMGTSLIEASMCGVPAIVALFKNPNPTCYGFFYNLKGYNVGEKDDEQAEISLYDVIKNAISWSDEDYKKECIKNANYATKFSIDNVMGQFIKYAGNPHLSELKYLHLALFYGYFYRYVIIKLLKSLYNRLKTL